jgi:hypothetical protein
MASGLPSWPPATGLTTVIVPAKSAVLTVYSSCKIKAPASLVFDVLRDTTGYPDWCTFVPRVTITSQPSSVPADSKMLHNATHFTFHVAMSSGGPNDKKPHDTKLLVSDLSTPASPSAYISQNTLETEPTFTSDLSRVYRIAWKTSQASLIS